MPNLLLKIKIPKYLIKEFDRMYLKQQLEESAKKVLGFENYVKYKQKKGVSNGKFAYGKISRK